jgi:solute carrier family 45, member 1/2/4
VTVVLAVFSIYFIDFSINAVMATDRALLVDILPASDQELGNAWAGRLAGVGSIAGFFVFVRRSFLRSSIGFSCLG